MPDKVDEVHRASNENEQVLDDKELILHLCNNIILYCEEYKNYEVDKLRAAIIDDVKDIVKTLNRGQP